MGSYYSEWASARGDGISSRVVYCVIPFFSTEMVLKADSRDIVLQDYDNTWCELCIEKQKPSEQVVVQRLRHQPPKDDHAP